MTVKLAETIRVAECATTVSLLNSGIIDFHEGGEPDVDSAATGTKLATFTFAATAFSGTVDDGTYADAAANTIPATVGLAAGLAGYFRVYMSNGITTCLQGSITGVGGGGDIEMGNTSIALGQAVDITTFIYRKRQS